MKINVASMFVVRLRVRAIPVLLLTFLSVCGCAERSTEVKGTEPDLAESEPRAIAILAGPGVADATLDATAGYVRQYWPTHCRTGRIDNPARAVPAKRDACLLVLVRTPADDPDPLTCLKVDGNIAILNTAALEKEGLVRPAGEVVMIQRLINKEAMRGVGLMLGMQPCPFFRCALHHAQTERDLRAKGQNYCPPCWGKVADAMKNNELENLAPAPKRKPKKSSPAPDKGAEKREG
jgi:hypothetical protein